MDFFDKKEIKFHVPSSSQGGNASLQKLLETGLDFFQEKKEITATVVIVVFSLLALFSFLGDRLTMIGELERTISMLRDKEAPIEEYQKAQKMNKDFFASAPESLGEAGFINEITSLATRRNVRILSYSPMEPTPMSFYTKINVHMNCAVENMRDAMLFLHDVERSSFSIRVDKWEAARDENATSGSGSDIVMDAIFSSVYLNEQNIKNK